MILTPIDEARFQNWYRDVIGKRQAMGHPLNPNPDDPEHFYDYRAAFANGADMGNDGHFPSQFKKVGNSRYTLNGMNTTDEREYPTANTLADLLGRMSQ